MIGPYVYNAFVDALIKGDAKSLKILLQNNPNLNLTNDVHVLKIPLAMLRDAAGAGNNSFASNETALGYVMREPAFSDRQRTAVLQVLLRDLGKDDIDRNNANIAYNAELLNDENYFHNNRHMAMAQAYNLNMNDEHVLNATAKLVRARYVVGEVLPANDDMRMALEDVLSHIYADVRNGVVDVEQVGALDQAAQALVENHPRAGHSVAEAAQAVYALINV